MNRSNYHIANYIKNYGNHAWDFSAFYNIMKTTRNPKWYEIYAKKQRKKR